LFLGSLVVDETGRESGETRRPHDVLGIIQQPIDILIPKGGG
jgi:hypothetical protein